MLINKIVFLLASAIFLIANVCSPTSSAGTAIDDSSDMGIGREMNETGEINVYINISLNPNPEIPLDPNSGLPLDPNSGLPLDSSVKFTISGPNGEYTGNGSNWIISNVSAGTYTINYEPLSGYETPAPETKNLTIGDSINFSSTYLLKKRSGESFDFGDGHILLIKQIDPVKNEVLMELQLDGSMLDEVKVKKHEVVEFNKTSYSVNKSAHLSYFSLNESGNPSYLEISLEDINRDAAGDYIYIYISIPKTALTPYKLLSINSVPQGADIKLDGKNEGKTPRSIKITDLRTYSIYLELNGYEKWEENIEIGPSNKSEIEETAVLKPQSTPTTIV